MRIATHSLFFAICTIGITVSHAQSSSQHSISSSLQIAANEISAGKLDQAENELQTVLRSSPSEYRALDLLGVIQVLRHNVSQAESLFSQAVENKPDFAPAHAHLGLLYLQTGQRDVAASELRDALRLDPHRTDASDALVHLLQEQAQTAFADEDWSTALALLTEAKKYAPNSPDIEYAFGLTALQLSLDVDAVNSFRKTLDQRKNDPLATYNLGRAFMGLSNFDEARKQFAKYVELRPEDPSGYCALGMTLAALERTNEAREEFKRSIALAPKQTESYFRLGLLDLESQNYEVGSKNLMHVLEQEPNHTGALTALGKLKFEEKQYSEAIPLLRKAITIDATTREAHYYLGLTLARLGQPDANEQLQIAIQLGQNEVEKRRTIVRVPAPDDMDPFTRK